MTEFESTVSIDTHLQSSEDNERKLSVLRLPCPAVSTKLHVVNVGWWRCS